MPGHKFGQVAELDKINLLNLDNTEVPGLDNLYEAEDVIKEAMVLMADFYGAKESIFLTNGSTAGILASILATCKSGETLIIARNVHHSVWHGLILSGVTPVYLSPHYDAMEDMLTDISAEKVREAFEQYPEAKGILLVSPTYEGVVSDIQAIAQVTHELNKILIVDEAHGAHFVLGKPFPTSSVHQGADLVIQSMHKTLPALTQSGLLHIGSDKVPYEEVVESLRMIQTSSPSYMMMGIMDYTRAYIETHQTEITKDYITPLVAFRRRLGSNLKYLRLLEYQAVGYDISKVVISTLNTSINGYELADILNREYHIVSEAATMSYIILMTTMADNEKQLGHLEACLYQIDGTLEKKEVAQISSNDFMIHDFFKGKRPRSIYYGHKAWESLEATEGKWSAQNVMLYPPGIPILCMGEQITNRHRTLIKRFKERLQGIQLEGDTIYIKVSTEEKL